MPTPPSSTPCCTRIFRKAMACGCPARLTASNWPCGPCWASKSRWQRRARSASAWSSGWARPSPPPGPNSSACSPPPPRWPPPMARCSARWASCASAKPPSRHWGARGEGGGVGGPARDWRLERAIHRDAGAALARCVPVRRCRAAQGAGPARAEKPGPRRHRRRAGLAPLAQLRAATGLGRRRRAGMRHPVSTPCRFAKPSSAARSPEAAHTVAKGEGTPVSRSKIHHPHRNHRPPLPAPPAARRQRLEPRPRPPLATGRQRPIAAVPARRARRLRVAAGPVGRHRLSAKRLARAVDHRPWPDHQLWRAQPTARQAPGGARRRCCRGAQPPERGRALPPRAGHRRQPDRLCRRPGAQDRPADPGRCAPPTSRPAPRKRMNGPGTRAMSAWIGEYTLLAALWGASFLFMRLGAAEFGPLPTAGPRVALAAVFLWPVLLHQGHWHLLRRHWRPIMLAGLLNSAIPFALFAWAVMHITTGLTSVLNATAPLFGALVAWAWLGERIDRLRWAGLALGFVGVVLLAWRTPEGAGPKTGQADWAMAACLLATGCYGLAASFARRYLSGIAPLAIATGSQLGAALGLALPTCWLWPPQTPGPRAWAAIAVVAVLCTSIAYTLYFRLIAHAGPSRAITVTLVAPVFAVLYGALFFGEAITLWMAGCALMIVCGTLLSTGLVDALRGRPLRSDRKSGV